MMQKNWQTNIALMGTLSFFLIACEASISITPGPSSRGTNSRQGSTSTTNPGSTQQTAPKTTQQPTTPPRETKRVCTQRQQWKTQLSPTKPQETFSSSFWLSPRLDKDTKGTDIATDAQGNIYITGYTLETSPYAPPNSDESYKATMFVAKISTQGQIMWVLSPTTQSSKKISRGYAITVDKQGYVYVAGDFWKTTHLGQTSSQQSIGTTSLCPKSAPMDAGCGQSVQEGAIMTKFMLSQQTPKETSMSQANFPHPSR
jgi:hypothetical protein